jgi:hypothetical protein
MELNFQVFPLVVIVRQPKKSGNWRKSHASANQIPESPEILFFQEKFLLFGLVNHQNLFRAEFSSFFVSSDCWPANKFRKLPKRVNQRELVSRELVKAK